MDYPGKRDDEAHLHSDLPKISVVDGRHEKSLRNIIHVPGIANICAPVSFTIFRCNLLQVLVVKLAFPVQASIHFSSRR